MTALIGLHICEPYLALTRSPDTKYSHLIPAYKQLYEDLRSCPPESLCQTSEQVFHFVSEDLFKWCKYKQELLNSLDDTIDLYKSEIINLLKIVLPRLADGFEHQKGHIFGFGLAPNEVELPKMKILSNLSNDELKFLDTAPVHNLHEERNVGLVNYELSRRGYGNLNSVSRKNVLNKSFDLIKCPQFRNRFYKSSAKNIAAKFNEWNESQKIMEELNFKQSEMSSMLQDKRKLDDLAILASDTNLAGPFSSIEDINKYMNLNISEKVKSQRLYVEVRYAKLTSSIPNSPFFRLRESGKYLPIHKYAENLKIYFSKVTECSSVTMTEFNHAISSILNSINNKESRTDMSLETGDIIAAFWFDDKDQVNWYLGVVESIKDNSCVVNYMERYKNCDNSWIYPNIKQVYDTMNEQIIGWKIEAQFSEATNRLTITKQVSNNLIEMMKM